jgi:protoporphyrinogen oxidase
VTTAILGGGLTGLSAGLVLAQAGRALLVVEGESAVGGLARTVARGAFRFDLGGHRFFTSDGRIEAFLRELMGEELARVSRRSTILLGSTYFDYPLRPSNAIRGLGVGTALRMLSGYAIERVKGRFRDPRPISLEDWVVSRFGRSLFRVFFKGYSEKVWGIDCGRISAEWVEQRIQGLSLGAAIRSALFRSGGGTVATLAGEFLYPTLGIGRIAERLQEEIERDHRVLTGVRIERLAHRDGRIERLTANEGGRTRVVEAEEFVSTIPLTSLLGMLEPAAPADVREAASHLRYRDLVVVAVMLDRPRVTDQTWIYVPDPEIPFGRLHEPTNWSARMAPPGKTLLVTEHFCFRGDATWRARDEDLAERTVAHLARRGLIRPREVIASAVVRVPNAYPLFEVGYREHHERICAYLGRFRNLEIAGRGGTFKYLNMDHAIAAGIEAAERILTRHGGETREARGTPVLAGTAR